MEHQGSKNIKPYHWQKGVSGNPGGQPKLPAELRVARRENMAKLITIIHRLVGLTSEEAKHELAGPDCNQLQEMVQGQINRASEGDARSFQFLIEVMCGKIPESDETASMADTLTAQQKLEAVKKMAEILEREVENESRSSK